MVDAPSLPNAGARQLVSARALAAAERLGPTVRPLVTDEHGRYRLVGSGVVVQFGVEVFLFTAAHVLDQPFLSVGVSAGFADLRGEAIKSEAPGGRRQDDRADIGIVQCPPDLQETLAAGSVLLPSDLDVDDQCLEAPSTKHYLTLGYPASQAEFRRWEKRARLEGFVLTSKPATAQAYQEAGVPDLSHIVLSFERTRTTASDGQTIAPNIHGVSGGGIWNLGNEYHSTAEGARLAGIAIEWHRRKANAIVGTRVSLFCEVLRQRRPNLSDLIPRSKRLHVTQSSASPAFAGHRRLVRS